MLGWNTTVTLTSVCLMLDFRIKASVLFLLTECSKCLTVLKVCYSTFESSYFTTSSYLLLNPGEKQTEELPKYRQAVILHHLFSLGSLTWQNPWSLSCLWLEVHWKNWDRNRAWTRVKMRPHDNCQRWHSITCSKRWIYTQAIPKVLKFTLLLNAI